MRISLLMLFMVLFSSLKAQTYLPLNDMNYAQRGAFSQYQHLIDTSNLNKKWSLNKYGGISTSFGFFNGGSSTMFSAPVGLQLNRRLNNNLYAFAGVSAAPVYFSLNNSFSNPDLYKNNSGINGFSYGKPGFYSRAEAGLMYINLEKTFSISGSIGIERSRFPSYPYPYPSNRTNTQGQQPFVGTR